MQVPDLRNRRAQNPEKAVQVPTVQNLAVPKASLDLNESLIKKATSSPMAREGNPAVAQIFGKATNQPLAKNPWPHWVDRCV